MPDPYRDIILASRKEQLKLTATNVRRLEITFQAAIESIAQKIAKIPAERIGTPWHRAMLQLTADIRTVMDGLRKDYTTLLDVGMIELAQNAAERERQAAALVNAATDPGLLPSLSNTFSLTNGQSLAVQFGRLALGAVERVATRYYRDGLRLSDRIHKLDAVGRKVVEDTIVQGVAEGLSARNMAKKVRDALGEASQDGQPAPRHIAMRIARTEINNAHREAHIQSTMSGGALKPYISGVRWNLSFGHKDPDICDVWATHDSGAGPGIYLPDNVPVDHPHGLCYTTTVLKAYPESGIGGATPDVSKVPPSMIAYYAGQGDAPASALAAQGAGE